jgi:hypothetical protein
MVGPAWGATFASGPTKQSIAFEAFSSGTPHRHGGDFGDQSLPLFFRPLKQAQASRRRAGGGGPGDQPPQLDPKIQLRKISQALAEQLEQRTSTPNALNNVWMGKGFKITKDCMKIASLPCCFRLSHPIHMDLRRAESAAEQLCPRPPSASSSSHFI